MQDIYIKLPIWSILAVSCFLHIQHSFIPGRIPKCGSDGSDGSDSGDSSVQQRAAAL